uniref:T-cell receptor alpha chain constant domain-containing protein n=1 Tax=Laticauda laticaudata TaxID=8630 RepID=A0A8C5RHE2_LATLA
ILNPRLSNLQSVEPSVYQLESKKESSDLAACLITDYSSNLINIKFNDSLDPVATSGSVVVVKDGDKESASLGVVIWSKNKDQFQCSAIYNRSLRPEDSFADTFSIWHTIHGLAILYINT